MRIVVALGGNALLRRGEPMTVENQRRNVARAARALVPLAQSHELVLSHGTGPQVGLLALQGQAYRPEEAYPLDVLDAQAEGMIGYLIEQELSNRLPAERVCVTLLTRIEVDPDDAALEQPTKPIGPVYSQEEGRRLASVMGWTMAPDGDGLRRTVPSPRPTRIASVPVIELLVSHGVLVICAGGGGIPTVREPDGSLRGVEAVIDKDHASSLLARELGADFLLLLTDVDALYTDWDGPRRPVRRGSPEQLEALELEAGSMGPKVDAAVRFVRETGRPAGIGALQDASAVIAGAAGTRIAPDGEAMSWWPDSGSGHLP